MQATSFWKSGHPPTLFCSFLYFDVSFMVWVLLGALGNFVAVEFGLSDAEKGLMVAVPILGGAILRLVLGVLTDRVGARRTGTLGLLVTVVPLALGWLWADSFSRLLFVGLLLGVAGASFAAALPLASRWYPPRYQGLAMGIAGAGNSGTALATFFAPRLAEAWSWHAVFGLAIVPVLLTLGLFVLLARDSPAQPEPRPLAHYVAVLRHADTWWFCFFYAVTFGGFVGLASFLSIFFHDQFALSRAQAGSFATLCVIAGSCFRPIGGYVADRIGGLTLLTLLYLGAGCLMFGLATLPELAWCTAGLFLVMGLLGMGNGAVFQLVPQRFSREIGVVTGVVGAAGGVGGFLLPNVLGGLKQLSGSFAGGFLCCGVVGLLSMAAILRVGRLWEGVFVGQGGLAAGPAPSPSVALEAEAPA